MSPRRAGSMVRRARVTMIGLVAAAALATGCAAESGMRTVEHARWQAVPEAERAPADRAIEEALAAARAQEAAAIAAVADVQRALAAPVVRPAVDAGGSWLTRTLEGTQPKVSALARIERARRAALAAELTWNQQRAAAAAAKIAMIEADRELQRATVIDDRAIHDEDRYDVTPFRGQLAHAQVRWFALDDQVAAARSAKLAAGQQLTEAKEAFAQLVRAEQPEQAYQLSKWTQLQRRGLTAIDRTTLKPCRRRTCFRQPVADTIYLTIAEPRPRRRAAAR
jgi:hypothetical protein